MKPETKAKVRSITINAAIIAAAAAATATLQYLQGVDFGEQTPFIVAVIGIAIKALQTIVLPPPGPL